MTDFDSPWKEALENYFESFLTFFFQPLHAEVDWSRGFEMLDKELQQITPDAELGSRTVDKLVKVWLRSGEEAWILIHVEVQSWEESGFAKRMYVYHYRLSDRYNRPVVSLAVLADERATWRPSRFESTFGGCTVSFTFPIVKLVDWAADWSALERDPNPFALITLAYLKAQETRRDPDERLSWKLRLVKDIYRRCESRNEFQKLLRLIDWFLDLPKPQAITYWQEIRKVEEEKRMPFVTTHERFAREEGLEKGREEGRTGGLREAICIVLKLQYGADGRALLPDVQALNDLPRLEELLRLIEAAAPLDQLRAAFK